jgi:hypothetical protein
LPTVINVLGDYIEPRISVKYTDVNGQPGTCEERVGSTVYVLNPPSSQVSRIRIVCTPRVEGGTRVEIVLEP